MQPARITLGQIMGMIAVVGVIFAVSPEPMAIGFSGLLIFSVSTAAFTRCSWSRIAAWGFACYPLLALAFLYVTWWAAWCALGHPPRCSADDPALIGPLVDSPYSATKLLLEGVFPALLANSILAVIESIRALWSSQDDLRGIAIKVVLPMLSWPFAYIWIMVDPGDVFCWFID
jgi:hypothetical protein